MQNTPSIVFSVSQFLSFSVSHFPIFQFSHFPISHFFHLASIDHLISVLMDSQILREQFSQLREQNILLRVQNALLRDQNERCCQRLTIIEEKVAKLIETVEGQSREIIMLMLAIGAKEVSS